MRLIVLAATLALSAGPLAAQSGPYWVGIQGGYDLQNNSSRNAKDNGILGVAGGSWCTSRWGYEFSVLGTQLKAKTGGFSADEYHGQLSALFNLSPGGDWTPYLRAGLGGTQVGSPWSFAADKTTRFSEHAGIGVQRPLGANFMLGLEVREMRIETQVSYGETLGLLTLGYRWGGAAMPAAAPVPAPRIEAPAPAPAPEPAPAAAPAPEPAPVAAPAAPAPAPAPAVVLAPAPQPMPPARIVLDEAVLHFANGKSELSPEGVQAVRRVAGSLKAFQGRYSLLVSGHTSSVGNPAFNKALSKRRADAVAKVLVDEGIAQESIQTAGIGPDQPLADNKTKAGQARNRRVEIEVKVTGAQVDTNKIETSISE